MNPTHEKNVFKQNYYKVALLLSVSGLNGCSTLLNSATQDFSGHLKQTIMDHNDPATVTDALPAYLLMMEASTAGDNASENQLLSTAQFYCAYLSLLPEDVMRKQRLSQRSLDLALRGACLHDDSWCGLQQKSFAELEALLVQTDADDIDRLYSVSSTWATWIQANKNDWNAVAQLAQVKRIMQRVLELDESYQQGNAHLYLAVMESLIPEGLGGKPDQSKMHFERAVQLAPNNLMTKVLFAKHYARMAFDRNLHDNLLKTVLTTQATSPGLTLINTLAQQQAQPLLDSANDYF